jgi:hypothetical protein
MSKIGNPNNLKVFWSKTTKKPEQNSQIKNDQKSLNRIVKSKTTKKA